MAIRHVQQLPTDLPPARLFLDDIEEMIDVFRECASPPIEGKSRNEELVTYKLGNRICETKEDLLRIGGRTTNLELTYKVWQAADEDGKKNTHIFLPTSIELLMNPYRSTLRQWRSEEEAWTIYGRIRAVFDRRRRRMRAMTAAVSGFGEALIGYSAIGSWMLAILVLGKLKESHYLGRVSTIALLALWTALVVYFIADLFRHSIVEFRYSHEGSQFRTDLKNAWPQIVSAIIGAAIGALVTRFLSR